MDEDGKWRRRMEEAEDGAGGVWRRRRMEDKEDGGGRGLRRMEKMDEVHRM